MIQLHLANGQTITGDSVGAEVDRMGEVVFTTGMTGYLEILTDPSYFGQIVSFTFPLIGNYGVFDEKAFAESLEAVDKTYESDRIWVKGVVMSEVSEEFSHCDAFQSFCAWLKKNNIPALTNVDTRALTQTLREEGCILGSLSSEKPAQFTDPLNNRYVPEVSPKEVTILKPEGQILKTIAFIDCGAKNGILRNFLSRGIQVVRMPFDMNPLTWMENQNDINQFDGVFFSNGPGDPEAYPETIETMREVLKTDLPIFGICLGNQMLGLAAGGNTRKMKYGHRGLNQPVGEVGLGGDKKYSRCLITSQNHGYEVDPDTLPADFEVSWVNLNDQSVEGIRHKTKPVFAVQFHPESCAGPEDAQYLFDEFIKTL